MFNVSPVPVFKFVATEAKGIGNSEKSFTPNTPKNSSFNFFIALFPPVTPKGTFDNGTVIVFLSSIKFLTICFLFLSILSINNPIQSKFSAIFSISSGEYPDEYNPPTILPILVPVTYSTGTFSLYKTFKIPI